MRKSKTFSKAALWLFLLNALLQIQVDTMYFSCIPRFNLICLLLLYCSPAWYMSNTMSEFIRWENMHWKIIHVWWDSVI